MILSIMQGFELVQSIKGLSSLLRRDDDRLNEELCKLLRCIYFMPDGVLGLLKEIAGGDKVPGDRIKQALLDFNDRESEVSRALDSIDFRALVERGLPLRVARDLQNVRHGKTNLRRDVQNEINFYGQKGATPNQERLKSLIDGIELLNSEIEEIEEAVNPRSKSR